MGHGRVDGPDRTLFISYRVSDTGPTATWLSQELAETYGREHVFLDHERLGGGVVWPEQLKAEARRASVMLVLIGEGWLRAQDPETFVRRIDQEGDWVRKEIETALDAGSLVVPLLVEGAKPLAQQAFATVPSLAPLAERQTLPLRRKDWASDLERLHELLAAHGFVRRRSDAGGSDVVVARPFTIPAPVADFTGRKDEIAELETALTRNGRAAICAVNGMGGVGKSQLAFELAQRMAEHFPDGQVYLDLLGTAPEPLTPEAALADLIYAVRPDAKPPADRTGLKALYRQTWRERQALLLLDNARDEKQVQDLVPPAPVVMLVTSRRQIILEGGRMLRLDVLPEPQAIGLVREVLGTSRTLTEEEARELAQECGRLPLALRAAASFLLRRSGWTVAEYLAELHSRGIAALDKVETVLGLSLDRLAVEDSELVPRFALLGVFPAGFDAAAAAAVWQTEPRAARDALDGLADWSLVQVEAMGRYRLHDLVRDLAAHRAEPAALENARARHAGHYVEVLAQTDDAYLSGRGGILKALSVFDVERVNIEAGYRWAAESARSRNDAVMLVSRYSNAGLYVLDLRLAPRQAIDFIMRSLTIVREFGDRRTESRMLRNLGNVWAALGEAKKAVGFLEQSLAIVREFDDRCAEGKILHNIGDTWAALGEAKKAVGFLEQSLAIAREFDDWPTEIRVLRSLGNVWVALGEAKKAVGFLEQSLAIAREFDDRRAESEALCSLGNVWAALGEAKKAVCFYEQSLAIARAFEDWRNEREALYSLGNIWAALGEAKKAVCFYEQSLAIARAFEDWRNEQGTLWKLALALEVEGNREQAVEHAQASLVIHRRIEDPFTSKIEAWLRERGIDP